MRLLSTIIIPSDKNPAEAMAPTSWTLRTGNVTQALQLWVGTIPKMWPPEGPGSLPAMLVELTEGEMNQYFRDGMASVVKTVYGSVPAQPAGSNLQCDDFVLMGLVANVLYGRPVGGLPWRPDGYELSMVLRQSPQLQQSLASLLAASDLGKIGIGSWWLIPIDPDQVTWANTPACPSQYPAGWQATADGDIMADFFTGESPPLYMAADPGFQKPPQPSVYVPPGPVTPGPVPPVTPVAHEGTSKSNWPWYVAIGGGLAAAAGLMIWLDSKDEPAENPTRRPAAPRQDAEWATVDFLDGNSTWREHGWLVQTGKGFTLHVVEHGKIDSTRVFPLGGRRAEIYFEGDPDESPVVIEHDWKPQDGLPRLTGHALAGLATHRGRR